MFKIGDEIQWSFGPHDAYRAKGIVCKINGDDIKVKCDNGSVWMKKTSNRIVRNKPAFNIKMLEFHE